jgi:hypothetical protein
MQAFSDPSLNFLFVLGVIALITICCGRSCSRGSRGDGSSFASASGIARGCGTCSIVLGMAFFYSFGYYGFPIAAGFLILGMCLMAAGGCSTGDDRTYTRSQSRPRAYTPRASISQTPTANAVMRAAQLAQQKGMLDERPDPNNPNLMIPGIRCPACGARSDLETTRIIGNTVHCPNCSYQIEF